VTAGVGPQIRDHDGFGGLQRLIQEGGSLAGRRKQRAHIVLPAGGGEWDQALVLGVVTQNDAEGNIQRLGNDGGHPLKQYRGLFTIKCHAGDIRSDLSESLKQSPLQESCSGLDRLAAPLEASAP
jgi:hypothetical protein